MLLVNQPSAKRMRIEIGKFFRIFALILINQAKELYKSDSQLDVEISNNVFAIDSTTIDLCLSIFSWTKFRKTKAAIKLHTVLNTKTSIPEVIHISDGKMHDVNFLDIVTIQPDSFYILDKGYVDFERLYRIHKSNAFFITRAKKGLAFKRIYSATVDKESEVICDQTIKLTGYKSSKSYPDKLRRIKYYDQETGKTFVFLTNNFEIPAITIALLYKHRWFIELIFKWIKQ